MGLGGGARIARRREFGLHEAILKVGRNHSRLQLRGIERIDADAGFIEGFAGVHGERVNEIRALVFASGGLAAPAGQCIVARYPHQRFVAGKHRQVARDDLKAQQGIALRIAAHGAKLRVDTVPFRSDGVP